MSEPDEFAIWPPYEAFYISSMLFSTDSALHAASALAKAIETKDHDWLVERQESILNQIQNIVLHGANLSKFFWPVRKGHEKRAEKLRDAFSVDDSSPLKSRDLRNDIEHFDEKLDDYLKQGIVGHIIPHYLGLSFEDEVPTHLFRAYFLDTGVYQVLGKQYEIQPLVNEIQRIHHLLMRFDKTGSRFPSPNKTEQGAAANP